MDSFINATARLKKHVKPTIGIKYTVNKSYFLCKRRETSNYESSQSVDFPVCIKPII